MILLIVRVIIEILSFMSIGFNITTQQFNCLAVSDVSST